MKGALGIITGLGLGAAAMYLLDPQGGRRRRAMIRDKATSANRRTQRAIRGRAKDISNRAKGLLHETRSAIAHGADAEQQHEQTHYIPG